MNHKPRLILFADSAIGLAFSKCLKEHGGNLRAIILKDGVSKEIRDQIIEPWLPEAVSVHFWKNGATNRELIEKLRECDVQLGILAWWPFIISDEVINLASQGFLNTHPSLLPYGRGKDPNFWSIVEESPFGVTLHWVSSRIDGGAIAFQQRIEVEWTDTGGSLYEKSICCIEELFKKNARQIVNGDIPARSQSYGGSFHSRRELEPASAIDLDAPTTARKLLNLIRARTFSPHPACRFYDKDQGYEVSVSIKKLYE